MEEEKSVETASQNETDITPQEEDREESTGAQVLEEPEEEKADEGEGQNALPKQPLSGKEKRRQKKEEKEAQKAALKEEAERKKREEEEEKARRKRLAKEERQRVRHEKKEARSTVRGERRKEVSALLHTAEFVMLAVFIVLAVDQAGLYGFLFVWLFIALMAASVALLLLGIVCALRKKRCGIIFFVAIAGILLCSAWFIFLVSSQGLGLGPISK